MKLSHSDQLDIENEGCKALIEYLNSCTVTITSSNERFEHGSGVAVRYANQDYILTAAHVLKQEPTNENILVIGRSPKPLIDVQKNRLEDAIFTGSHGKPIYVTPSQLDITDRIFGKNNEDIAALKVHNVADSLPNTIFHNLTNQNETKINIGEIVNIFGFPGELGKQLENRITGQRGWALFSYLDQREIKSITNAPEILDPEVYLIADLTPNEKSCYPKGMSGCGVWKIPKLKDDELWSPSESQLLGIQCDFYPKSMLLRAVRIERILNYL